MLQYIISFQTGLCCLLRRQSASANFMDQHPLIYSAQYCSLYHGLAIYREVTFVNVTSVAENTK